MKIIEPYIEILDEIDGKKLMKKLELIGRVCYKSEEMITPDSSGRFLKKIIELGHESVIEHESISVRVVCDRGISHGIVRHRIASYSQESTRYCNYTLGRFGSEITVIRPLFWETDSEEFLLWKKSMEDAENVYNKLIAMGARPEEARAVLPNSLKTEIVMTMNIREWRHFFKLRTSNRSHPQMRQVANMILKEFRNRIPVLFDDITESLD